MGMICVSNGFDAGGPKGYQSVNRGWSLGEAGRMKRLLAMLVASLGLAGCVEQMATAKPDPAAVQRTNMARRPGVSPSGATVALASLDGAPQEIVARFTQVFAREAQGRDIAVAPSASAHYIVRGYLDAAPAASGVNVAFVWDVFDARKSRAQRVTDSIVVPGAAADPWSVVDDKALASVAGKAADELAAFLTNTPEAIAATGQPRPQTAAAPAAPTSGVSVTPMSAPAAPAPAPARTAAASLAVE